MSTNSPNAVPTPLTTLRKRADFLGVAAVGRKWVTAGFIIQAANWPLKPLPAAPVAELRFGLTASKKTGNAVTRNRARRRLRALAQEILPLYAAPNHAFVLIARAEATVTRDYAQMKKDLIWALKRLEVLRDGKA